MWLYSSTIHSSLYCWYTHMKYSRREAELHLTQCQLGGKPSTPRLASLTSGYLATSSLTLGLKLHSLRFADFAGQLHLGFPCAGLTEITFITKKNQFNFQNITKNLIPPSPQLLALTILVLSVASVTRSASSVLMVRLPWGGNMSLSNSLS